MEVSHQAGVGQFHFRDRDEVLIDTGLSSPCTMRADANRSPEKYGSRFERSKKKGCGNGLVEVSIGGVDSEHNHGERCAGFDAVSGTPRDISIPDFAERSVLRCRG